MSNKRSNVSLLTEGAKYIKRAKKEREEQVEEIKFDDTARREFLTGFSKRKKQRTDERRKRAQERDRVAHREEVRKARQELKERAKQNVKDVRAALGLPDLEAEKEGEEEEDEEEDTQQVQEFSDDEQVATVTIQEDFDPAAGPSYAESDDEDDGLDEKSKIKSNPIVPLMPASSRAAEKKAKREKDKAKAKKEKEVKTMETPAERRRAKEHLAKKRAKRAGKEKEREDKMAIQLSQQGGPIGRRNKGFTPSKKNVKGKPKKGRK